MGQHSVNAPTTPPGKPDQVFVLTTSQDVHQETFEEIAQGEEAIAWTVQSQFRLGAWFLIYVKHPIRAFAWIGRGRSDAHRPLAAPHQFLAWTEILPLRTPVPVSE